MSVPANPTLHGDLLVVAVATPDPQANEYRSRLSRIPLDGSGAAPFTWGPADTAPALSPDGRWLAFLRKAGGDKPRPQLHVMPSDGGDARCVTSLPLGVSMLAWAPDSRRIAVTARIPEPGRYGGEDPEWGGSPAADAEAPRRITRMDYAEDNIGYLLDRNNRLFVVDVTAESPEPVELTDGTCDVREPAWTPDGEHLVVVSWRDFGTAETLYEDLYTVPAAGGELALLVRTAGFTTLPSVTPDNTVLYYCTAHGGVGSAEANNHGLWAVPFQPGGGGQPRRLTDAETVDIEPPAGRPALLGGDVLVAVRNRGAVELRRVPLDADAATLDQLPVLLGDKAVVKAFGVDGDRVAAVVSTADTPGDVVLLRDGSATTLATFAEPLRAAGLRPLTELTATAPDGYPVHGWLVLPEGDGPHPVLLCVHGGPFMYYNWGFFDEAQVYASAGYAVVMGNPRGSAGYGQSHGRAIVRALGTVDVDDVLALLDAALARPDLDAERVGVMGGSYGGFMTSWLAGHHGEKFTAAWSERAVNAWDSFSGSSDIGWFFTEGYVGPDPEEQRRKSPLTYADRIRIPFAVVHSENDLRCPIEQAQRMFVALKRNGTEVEMLVFPGEGHELTRSGKPRHRVQRFRAVLDWWARQLKVAS